MSASAPYWIANEGQWQGDFQFKCEVGSTIYYVTPQGMTVDFKQIVGADGNPPAPSRHEIEDTRRQVSSPAPLTETVKGHVLQIHYSDSLTTTPNNTRSSLQARHLARGANKLPHYSNYFLGRDSTKWRSRVGHYENVIVPEVWPGIDVEYRADQQGVETIYHVKPGADPSQIQMEYLGLDAPLRVDAQGNLILTTSLGDVKEKAPFAFQQEARTQKRVNAAFRVIDETRVGYDVGEFDAGKELVVDPLIYSTFFANGPVDYIDYISIDPSGNPVISGTTDDPSFPTTPGTYWETGPMDFVNGFVSKLSHDGLELVFSTYFVANEGKVFASRDSTIWWMSSGPFTFQPMPLTANAIDTIIVMDDLGIARLSGEGTELLFASYWGGSNHDEFGDICEDQDGLIYLMGETHSQDLYTTPSALSHELPEGNNVFITVLNPSNYTVVYSTYLPTTNSTANILPNDISCIETGKVWLSCYDFRGGLITTEDAIEPDLNDTTGALRGTAYFSLIDITENEILYASYWGNQENEGGLQERITSIIPIDSERLLLCGDTDIGDYEFPIGGFQQRQEAVGVSSTFVVKLHLPNEIEVATYMSGSRPVNLIRAEMMRDSTIVLAGLTSASDFPVTFDAADSTFGGGPEFREVDAGIVKLSADLSTLQYGTYMGGLGYDYLSTLGTTEDRCWMAGWTESPDFEVTADAMFTDFDAIQLGYLACFQFPRISNVRDRIAGPDQLLIASAFPNPFNPTTTLEFTLPSTSSVELTVHDILGREVTHENLGRLTAGQHVIHINGSEWSSGIYFATLTSPARSQTTKLLLLR